MDNQEYHKIKKYSYQDYCNYLKDKYGSVHGYYMSASGCRNKKRARGKDGLVLHHIYEDRVPGLCDRKDAHKYPHEYQLGDNLVYCDYLEHLLLHIMICEHPCNKEVGHTGITVALIPTLNGWYSGDLPTSERLLGCYQRVANDKDVYLDLVGRFISNRRKQNSAFEASSLCKGVKLTTNGERPAIYNRILAEERGIIHNETQKKLSRETHNIRKRGAGMVIAVDFDNTLFETDYPKILRPNKDVIEAVKRLQNLGNKVILNTCRKDQYLADAVEACSAEGLVFDAVNENLPERMERFGGDCRKISADIYLEDRMMHPNELGLLFGAVKEEK